MSPESWKKVKEAFAAAIELSGDERQKFIDALDNAEIREKVRQMIAADETNEDSIDDPVINLSTLWSNEKHENLIGAKLGNYKILRDIGRGGMGIVFEVIHETEDVIQNVALKILKSGIDSEILLRSFHNERKILASLEHQHIVRLLDAGMTADGLPFYTMELVEGKPLDTYATEKNLNLEERLKLFQQICSAIIYAHGKLVVHRDLKPSNILVTTDGNVKLLDFGIAKIISLEAKDVEGTATRFGIMTPHYASPEQIRGETVTVASDVYSLGIILYELLTGVLPHNFTTKNPLEIAKIITEIEPQKPSEVVSFDAKAGKKSFSTTRNPQLKGDLDTIILKALKKIPSRRYSSVEQFSNDISRYLKGLPITARPDTFCYRAEKFIKRNSLSVGAVVFMITALLIGSSVAIWQAIHAERQRVLAERRFDEIRELANKVVFRYHDEIAKLPGSTPLREELVTDAVKYLDSLLQEEIDNIPLKLQIAKTYRKVGDVQGKPYTPNLGKSDDALKSYRKSVSVLESALKIDPNNVEIKKELILSLLSEVQMGVRVNKARKDEILIKSQQLQDEISSSDLDLTEKINRQANIYLIRGDLYVIDGDLTAVSLERIALYQKSADLIQSLPEKNFESQMILGRATQRIGSNYIWLGNQETLAGNEDAALNYYKQALPYHQKYLEIVKNNIGDAGSPITERRIATGYHNLGQAYIELKEFKLGFENLQESLSRWQNYAKINPGNNEAQIDLADCYYTFVDAYEKSNNLPLSIEFNKKSLEILNKIVKLDATDEVMHQKINRMYKLVELYDKANQPKQSQNVKKQLAEICSFETIKPYCKN